MRRFAVAIGFALLAVGPALGQIVKPTISQPPCSGQHCLSHVRTIHRAGPRPPSALSAACPAGTVFNPQKGTCKVLPPTVMP